MHTNKKHCVTVCQVPGQIKQRLLLTVRQSATTKLVAKFLPKMKLLVVGVVLTPNAIVKEVVGGKFRTPANRIR